MSAEASAPTEFRRLDYKPYPYEVPEVALSVALNLEFTEVTSTLTVRVPGGGAPTADLVLDADWKSLELLSVSVGDAAAEEGAGFVKAGETLVIPAAALAAGASADGTVKVTTANRQKPQLNKAFEGLYLTGGAFMTQMEADGFRRFAPHPDRPDVMSRYSCRISAPKAGFPVLLGNGNCTESGEEGEDRHWVLYRDPWPKPSYLFALVAGDLAHIEGHFLTREGRDVRLRVYTSAKDVHKCGFALESLQRAMKWDEDAFGRLYDLDEFNVVVAEDFNMGAMENKSLNIFNTKYVLVGDRSASDMDRELVEAVIGHEYFHNWSGNRVTCRDWFSLTLKEGFTVFRDGEFTADMASRAMKRVRDAATMRSRQFAEDSSAMSHSVRPDAVSAMSNLYSVTVYNKGAEVVRMYRTLLGSAPFRRATDWYFDRFDGQAVTCDQFATAMEEANWAGLPAPVGAAEGQSPAEGDDAFVDLPFTRCGPRPLTQFRRWYAVAGTPEVHASGEYDAAAGTYTLRLRQTVPDTASQKGPKPALHIPVACALLGPDGRELDARLRHEPGSWAARWGTSMTAVPEGAPTAGPDLPGGAGGVVLHLTEPEQAFVFEGVHVAEGGHLVPSLLRGFSAPVRLVMAGDSLADRLFRVAHDADAYCRWDAADSVAVDLVSARVPAPGAAAPAGALADDEAVYFRAISALLRDAVPAGGEGGEAPLVDPALVAEILSLPDVEAVCAGIKKRDGSVDPAAVAAARAGMRLALVGACGAELVATLDAIDGAMAGRPYQYTTVDAARRVLRGQVLSLLAEAEANGTGVAGVSAEARAFALLRGANNMSDQMAALVALSSLPAGNAARAEALEWFYEQWKDDALVTDKWFAVQARNGTVDEVARLLTHPAFNSRNPNKVYSVMRVFAALNYREFHHRSGEGYKVVADMLADLDKDNPQVAARVASSFASAASWHPELRTLAKENMHRMLAPEPGREASKDLGEILRRTVSAITQADTEATA